jgi:hypothetical protein
MKAVRINPATPQNDATNLQETLRQVTSSTLRQQTLQKFQKPLMDLTGSSSDILKYIFKICVSFIYLSVFDGNIMSIYRFRTVPNVL